MLAQGDMVMVSTREGGFLLCVQTEGAVVSTTSTA